MTILALRVKQYCRAERMRDQSAIDLPRELRPWWFGLATATRTSTMLGIRYRAAARHAARDRARGAVQGGR